MEEFSLVGWMLRHGAEKSKCVGIVARFQSEGASLWGVLQGSDVKIFIQDLPAAGVDDTGCGADLCIRGSSDILFREIHQPAMLLQECEEGDDLGFGSWRWRRGFGGCGYLRLSWCLPPNSEKYENHADRCGYRLCSECQVLLRKINGGGVEAEKDSAACNETVFHKGRDSARCRFSWQWRFHLMVEGFCV